MMYDNDIKLRLRRFEGQARGVLRMMEEEQNCKDVVNQLSAIRSAIDKAIACVAATNLEKCLLEETGQDRSELVKGAVDLLIQSR